MAKLVTATEAYNKLQKATRRRKARAGDWIITSFKTEKGEPMEKEGTTFCDDCGSVLYKARRDLMVSLPPYDGEKNTLIPIEAGMSVVHINNRGTFCDKCYQDRKDVGE